MELKDEVAIVTGGGFGIGEAVCLKLAAAGAAVGIADINIKNAERVAGLVTTAGGRALAMKVDVMSSAEIKNMVQQVMDTFGRVDILVNNVGVSPKGPKGEGLRTWLISDEEWDFTMRVNLTSAFYCCREVIPHMMSRKSGKIVLMSSSVGKQGAGGGTAIAPYGASKAGVINLTFTLARELASQNIRVNSVSPGLVEGTMMRASASPESNERAAQKIPLKRFGKPAELAEAIYFLVSPASSYITGEILDCNGGMVMD
ncbi:MAG: SDR family oxidoreductase [Deltaproteobacteria bacterium]|nr:SDR family oxidoreductase [Deltaproteobacteria bacterium]